jgi:hypothetical protein
MSSAISIVGIVTRDRAAGMVACLESYIENCRRHDRAPEFVVIDDSRAAEAQTGARAALHRTAGRLNARIRYAGWPEKNRFAERLAAESSVPLDIIRFALFGDERCDVTVGANRNNLLLDTVDALVFSADDDTLCHVAAAPDSDDAVSVFSGYDPTELWFFPDRAGALESVSFEDIDVLGCHEPMLGNSAAVTMHGLVGDSAMASPRYYLSLTGASRERLTSSPEAYRSAFRSREVLRAVRRPTITAGPFFMTTFFGFDNRMPLPPFFPVQRNEDGIFGVVLKQCRDDGRIALLPWVLLHTPAPRSFTPDVFWKDAASVRMDDIVIGCLQSHGPASLVQLGIHLQRIGSLSVLEFEAYVRILQQHRVIALVTVLQSHLQTYGSSPAFWAADVSRMLEVLMKAPGKEDFIVPRDLPDEDARHLSRELVRRFGELLEAWPAITQASRRLRAQGIRLSDPIQAT